MKITTIIMIAVVFSALMASCSHISMGEEKSANDLPNRNIDVSYDGRGTGDTKVPYDTEMTGMHGGYFFIPIEGKIYRYRLSSVWDGNLTKSDFLYEFTEEEFDRIYVHRIYRIEEYQDDTVLYCVSDEKTGDPYDKSTHYHEEFTIEYLPNSCIADGELEKAIESGFVIMENGNAAYGKDAWTDFYTKITAGEPASVRIGNYYTIDREGAAEDYYEAVKADYPALYLKEVSFDGTQYYVSPLHRDGNDYIEYCRAGYDNPGSSWKYLMHFTGTPNSRTALITDYDRYVLVNDDTVSWENIERGMVSSTFGDYIPFDEVFCEYTWK